MARVGLLPTTLSIKNRFNVFYTVLCVVIGKKAISEVRTKI
jgi:hypothetical protein